jgi:hypothetical protein
VVWAFFGTVLRVLGIRQHLRVRIKSEWPIEPRYYEAGLAGQDAVGIGRTPEQAIGQLVRDHPKLFGLTVEIQESFEPPE